MQTKFQGLFDILRVILGFWILRPVRNSFEKYSFFRFRNSWKITNRPRKWSEITLPRPHGSTPTVTLVFILRTRSSFRIVLPGDPTEVNSVGFQHTKGGLESNFVQKFEHSDNKQCLISSSWLSRRECSRFNQCYLDSYSTHLIHISEAVLTAYDCRLI